MAIPLPDPIVGGRAARDLEDLPEAERVRELERRLESIQRNFDRLAKALPVGPAEIQDGAVGLAKIDHDGLYVEGVQSGASTAFTTTGSTILTGTFTPQRSGKYHVHAQTIASPVATANGNPTRADLSVLVSPADAEGRTARSASTYRESYAAAHATYETVAVDTYFDLEAGTEYTVSAFIQVVVNTNNWQYWSGFVYTFLYLD